MSSYIVDLLLFLILLRQFPTVKQETDDLSIFFRFIAQSFPVISVSLEQLSCRTICFRRCNTHLTVCRIIAILLLVRFSLFLQQIPLFIIKISERAFSVADMVNLVLRIVMLGFSALTNAVDIPVMGIEK